MFNSISNVLDRADDDVLAASSDSCDRILEAVDRYATNVQLSAGQSLIKLTTRNIAVEAVLVNSSSSYSFRPNFATGTSISVPEEAISTDDGQVRLKFVAYRNGKLFQQRGKSFEARGDPGVVLTASVAGHNVSGLSQPVTYTVPREPGSAFYSCVYWDEADKDWSTKGIRTSRSSKDGSIQCDSDHLTAFSVLLDPTPHEQLSGSHQYILKVISYVGSGLSVLGLSITVVLYSLFR